VSATLFLALVGLYVLSTIGIVVVGTLVESERDECEPESLEQRLAVVRAIGPGEESTEAPPPYFAGTTRRN
jgi:hypothetical protein